MPVSVSVRLPDKTAQALAGLASATERSRTYLIVKALEAYLAEYADYQVALDRLRDKDDPVVSSRELRQRFGRKDWSSTPPGPGSTATGRGSRGSIAGWPSARAYSRRPEGAGPRRR